jgi:hypothetical protein
MNRPATALVQIKNRIFMIRGTQVIINQVETRLINQAVNRKFDRFLVDFYSQLNDAEFEGWKSQIVMSNSEKMGFRLTPITFTEHSATKLISILKSDSAIN